MIIWLNGPFGVGKSSLAQALHERLSGSFVCDPELIGATLRLVTPQANPPLDFQDLPLWREFTRRTLEHLVESFSGTIIVPMTLVNPVYFEQIVGDLRASRVEIQHYTLLASRATVLSRLEGRGHDANSWPAQQLDRCLNALQDSRFARHLDTEAKSLSTLADEMRGSVGSR